MKIIEYLFITIFLLTTKTYAAKILAVIPTPSISHQLPFRPFLKELANRGHHLTVVTTDPAFPKGQAPDNYTEIDLHNISYDIWRKNTLQTPTGKSSDINLSIRNSLDIFIRVWEEQLKQPEIQKIINGTDNYDLLILEACQRGTLALRHKFKVPVIIMSSLGVVGNYYEVVGAPRHPILYPTVIRQKINNLTFWEKFNELYNHYYFHKLIDDHEPTETAIMRKFFGEDMPSLRELQKHVDMLFLNIHPIFEGNVPVPPTVVHVWGIHKNPKKELPEDLKSFLDSSKHGVIYMSLGTNNDPKFLPPETLKMMLRVLSKLPYDVLFKWNHNELPSTANNIKTRKWFPQPDLLRHPKIKLFITQGGLQSTDEAITAGVPLVGIPMQADQWFNVERYVQHGIGVRIDAETATEHSFRNAVTSVLKDESYKNNVVRLRSLVRDSPMSGLERAVWWTEHVLRHGGAAHLRSPAANISWAEYLELEFVLTLLALLLSIIIIAIILLYFMYSYLLKRYIWSSKSKHD